tara:strand:- start:820 stop:1077 length:258 start_codon:yes stop_codon:yes gene_type:complete
MVRVKGLEPPRLAAPEPKSGASTNSATPAKIYKLKYTLSLIAHHLAKLSARCEHKMKVFLKLNNYENFYTSILLKVDEISRTKPL